MFITRCSVVQRLPFQVRFKSELSIPKAAIPHPEYHGRSYEDYMQVRNKNLSPALFLYYKKPLLIHKGHMQYLWDDKGRQYLDLFGGICTVSVGHCHPKINAALLKQAENLWHSTNIYLHPTVHEYAEKLTSKLPGDLKVCYFMNSGSEANDMATLMARIATGKWEMITLRNGYHGASPFLMGATALSTWRFPTPTGFGFLNSVNADPYRGPWGGSHCRDSLVQTDRKCDCSPGSCKACDQYNGQLEDLIRFSCPKGGPAAFLIEGIQGVGGIVQFPKDYVKKAFDLVRSTGGLCIMDEVQTGFGRTGSHYWGFEGHGVVPDIVTLAKSIGNGFPLAAVVTTPAIAAAVTKALHFNTFGGNPLSCAVGSAVLDVIDEEKLQENSQKVGSYFLSELSKLKDTFSVIGDVRGKGFMLGMEFVSNRQTRAPLDSAKMAALFEDTKDHGILVGKGGFYGNVLRFQPPMCITKEDVDFTIQVLQKSISKMGKLFV